MSNNTLIEFPCHFSIKIIGNNNLNFIKEIEKITIKHFSDFEQKSIIKKPSKNQKYLGLTITVYVTNQPELDAFYQEISRHPEVKMML